MFGWFARFAPYVCPVLCGLIFAALPCGWSDSAVLTLDGLVLLFCLEVV